jgi:hypothetical protein
MGRAERVVLHIRVVQKNILFCEHGVRKGVGFVVTSSTAAWLDQRNCPTHGLTSRHKTMEAYYGILRNSLLELHPPPTRPYLHYKHFTPHLYSASHIIANNHLPPPRDLRRTPKLAELSGDNTKFEGRSTA